MKLSGETDQRFLFTLLRSVIEFCTFELSEKMNLEIMTPLRKVLKMHFKFEFQPYLEILNIYE